MERGRRSIKDVLFHLPSSIFPLPSSYQTMTYLNTRRFKKEGSILYNNVGANTLHGIYLDADNMANVGNYKKIIAGTFLTADNRVHGAAKVISPYTAGATQVVVDNPWSFQIGDVLYLIGDADSSPSEEKAAFDNKTTEFGTVTAINAGTSRYKATITPTAIAVGDVVNLSIEELSISVIAKTTVIGDLLTQIVDELNLSGRSDLGVLDYLDYTIEADTLVITAKETGTILTVNVSVTGTGTATVEVATGIGTIEITAGAGNSAILIGAKLSIVDSNILGIFAHSEYLTDDWRQEMTADTAAYDTANINLKALPYMDGAIAAQLPTLKFMPPYK